MENNKQKNAILEYLNDVNHTSDEKLHKRILRTISAFNANIEDNVFTREFQEKYITDDLAINDLTSNEKDVLDYLRNSHSGARMLDDIEIQIKLERAIAAFEADLHEKVLISE